MPALAYVCCLILFWNPFALASEPSRGDCEAARSAAGDAPRDYENVKGIGQKMKIHRLAIVPISAS